MLQIFRIVVGGIGSLSAEAIGHAAWGIGVDGFTLSQGEGFHTLWGSEPVTIIETATSKAAAKWFTSILCTIGAQECAYVVTDGVVAELWYVDGTVSTLEPTEG